MLRTRHAYVLAAGLVACGHTEKKPTAMTQPAAPVPAPNPLLTESTLYLHAPPFDRIKLEHIAPALEEGMKQQLAAVRVIADSQAAPTFENTIVAMEGSSALLTRANKAYSQVTTANTNPAVQKMEAEMSPKLTAHNDRIFLDKPLFTRVQAIYDQRDTLGLDPVQKRLVERYHLDFVRAGAQLNDVDQTTLRALNEEEAKLQTQYSELQLKEMNADAVIVDDVKQLDGLSPADIDAAAAAAKTRKLDGKWVLPLVNTTTQPALESLKDRALRERIFKASVARGSHGGPNDTRQLISRLAQLRAQKAKLLGFPDYASYSLDDQMAKTPKAALALLDQLAKGAVARAHVELKDMQAVIDKEHGGFKLQPWDWAFYAEKVRKARYDLDEVEVRPYFQLDRVLKDGVFFAAHELYGLHFKQRTDLPVYNPDMQVFEVFGADDKTIGLIYLDYFARESKHGGAWMESYLDQSDLTGYKPIVVNCLNIPKPGAGTPVLLSSDDVRTMFHEFGHGLHGLLSSVKYPYMSGTATPRDFVEFPSQFNENWMFEPRVLANYAKHFQTGAPIPEALVAKIKKASTFNQGFSTLEVASAQLLDMAWHSLPATAPQQDPIAFEKQALKQHGVDMAEVPPRYHTTYFSHIWGGGYSAGYYAYAWTAVLGADTYAWFKEHGGMTAENGKKFADGVLSKGGTIDAHDMYLAFRGHEPSVQPLIEQRGLTTPKKK